MIVYSKNCNLKLLDRKLQNMCNLMDRLIDEEVIATSGLRSTEHNKEVGGNPNSSHLKGLAIDIGTPNGKVRYKVIFAALAVGFKRIGIPKEFDHIHLDIDESKPLPTIFID